MQLTPFSSSLPLTFFCIILYNIYSINNKRKTGMEEKIRNRCNLSKEVYEVIKKPAGGQGDK